MPDQRAHPDEEGARAPKRQEQKTIRLRMYHLFLTLIVLGGGGAIWAMRRKVPTKCSHNNYTSLIKQMSLFDTALVMTNICLTNK